MWLRGILMTLCCLLMSGCGERNDAAEPVAVPNPPLGTVQETPEPEGTAGARRLESAEASPNGRYEVWMSGEAGDGSAQLMFWDSQEKLIRWWDGAYSVTEPTVRWSDEGTYVAINRSARTYTRITILETTSWSEWEFVLPDGGAIPEYVFLPDDWGNWTEENVLRVHVGRGGDAGEQTTYRCTMELLDGALTGTTAYAEEIIAEGYDFNHNGVPETVTLEGNAGKESTFWVLRIVEDGQELWVDTAALSHAGWNSLFACKIDGEDYLMRYLPGMWQGFANYQYQLFMLGESGEELVLAQNQVEFDEVYVSQMHTPFDREVIADFLWEVRNYLTNSKLLLSTEDGELQLGGTGIALKYYPFGRTYEDLMSLDSREAMIEALRLYEEGTELEQGIS